MALVGAATALRPEEALFDAMLLGWRNQQVARRLSPSTIEGGQRVVRRFAAFSGGWPWSWREDELEAWVAANGWRHSTVRSYQGSVGGFLGYVCDPRYGWAVECERRVGALPRQICHDDNRAVHVADYEGRPDRRPLSRQELQLLFDTVDDAVEEGSRSGRKGWLTAFRDAAMLKTIYGWGLRLTETAMLDVVDLTPNPAAPSLGRFGTCHVHMMP